MWTKAFWLASLERGIKTFAQVLAALLTADATGVMDADWAGSASVAAMATLLSFLTSIATAGITDGNPSIGSVETLDGRHEA
jgi:hypothetical protein